MAHILVADYDPVIRAMLADVLTDEGHWVTCVDNPWQLLSAMRGTLHPMVVLFYYLMLGDTRGGGEQRPVSIMMREEEDLRRHRLIETHTDEGTRWPEVRAFYDRLGVRQIRMPFELEHIINLVHVAAGELEPTT
jgi:CheY-like chemotaxis protein